MYKKNKYFPPSNLPSPLFKNDRGIYKKIMRNISSFIYEFGKGSRKKGSTLNDRAIKRGGVTGRAINEKKRSNGN